MFDWFSKKKKPNPELSYLANGEYSVKEVNHFLGRYAVVNTNEKNQKWFFISYFNDRNNANQLAEAYNRMAANAQARASKVD